MSDLDNDLGAVPGDQPSEEELRQYVEQLRGAPVDQVLAEISSALLNAAQVKLGRRDGRLLLDAVAAVADTIRGRVSEDLTGQLDQALTQLRLAQVDAEKQVAAAATDGHREVGDVGDAGSDSPPGGRRAEPPTSEPPSGGAASRLWTPGG